MASWLSSSSHFALADADEAEEIRSTFSLPTVTESSVSTTPSPTDMASAAVDSEFIIAQARRSNTVFSERTCSELGVEPFTQHPLYHISSGDVTFLVRVLAPICYSIVECMCLRPNLCFTGTEPIILRTPVFLRARISKI